MRLYWRFNGNTVEGSWKSLLLCCHWISNTIWPIIETFLLPTSVLLIVLIVEDVSQALAPELCLFQYPLRPFWLPYDNTQINDVRLRPSQYKFEIDFNLEKNTKYFDSEHELAEHRKKFTLKSSTVPLKTNYAIGVCKGSKLVTLVELIYKRRSSFNSNH
jgi:hypothetical protein